MTIFHQDTCLITQITIGVGLLLHTLGNDITVMIVFSVTGAAMFIIVAAVFLLLLYFFLKLELLGKRNTYTCIDNQLPIINVCYVYVSTVQHAASPKINSER